ncbi:MAG: dynamin family protein [Candidatus Dormibacteria bacterium]
MEPESVTQAAAADGLAERLGELSQLALLPPQHREVLAETAQKLRSTTVYVAVVGDFKRGKSSLINALLGQPILPVGVVPVTAQPTLIRYGPEPLATVTRESVQERIAISEIAQYITEKANPHNRLKVTELWVEYPSPLLQGGLVVVDTPGTGSLHEHNTETAQAFLPRIDVAIAVLTGESPLSLSEARWLSEVAGRAARVAVCLNKVDSISPEELGEAQEYIESGLRTILGDEPVELFRTSARRELASSDDQGIAQLRSWLTEEVGSARAQLVAEGAATVGRAAVELGRGVVALERAALAAPVEQARQRQQRVREAGMKLDRAGREGRALIAAQSKELIQAAIEPELDSLRAALAERLRQAPDADAWAAELSKTAAASSDRLQELVRLPLEEALIEQAGRLQEVLDHFLDEVTTLYQVALGPPPRLGDPARLPRVRVTTVDEPGALAMGVRAVRGALPGAAGRRWRQRARDEEAAQAADRLSGRLHFAAVAAVDEAVRQWLVWSDAQWRGLHEALTAALSRGEEAAEGGDAATQTQQARLQAADALMASVEAALELRPGF